MPVKESLLRILSDGKFYSGAQLGEMLGLSRSAIWKHIQSLQQYELDIYAVSGKGYRLARPLELLSVDLIRQNLQLDPVANAVDMDVLFDVDSTNRYLLEKSRAGYKKSAVCFAEYQHAGRGRRGRSWVSPFASSLCCSILWQSQLSLNLLSPLGLVIGVAVSQALHTLGLKGHKLKWPNDIYWEDRKLGGVLIETSGEISSPGVVVIGLGLNVCMSGVNASSIDQPWCDLQTALNRPVSRNLLAGLLIREIFQSLHLFEAEGFDAFYEAWRSYDLLMGRYLQIHLAGSTISGMGAGVDKQGALLVKDASGQITRYFSGDVSVRYSV